MKKKVWIVKPKDSDRPMVTAIEFGLYVTFPSAEAADAFSRSPLCVGNAEIIEGELSW